MEWNIIIQLEATQPISCETNIVFRVQFIHEALGFLLLFAKFIVVVIIAATFFSILLLLSLYSHRKNMRELFTFTLLVQ